MKVELLIEPDNSVPLAKLLKVQRTRRAILNGYKLQLGFQLDWTRIAKTAWYARVRMMAHV